MTLNDIKPGEAALVCSLGSASALRRRLSELGLIENTVVKCLGRSPFGDPSAYLIRGTVIALRRADCRDISVRPCS